MTAVELFEITGIDAAVIGEVRALLARCSDETLRARCLGGSPGAARLYLEALPTREHQFTVAAWNDHGMVGIGTLVDDAGGLEIAVLVEDAWHRHGIGTMLATRLADEAAQDGALAVTATASVTNNAAICLLHKAFPSVALGAPRDGLITAVCPVVTSGAGR